MNSISVVEAVAQIGKNVLVNYPDGMAYEVTIKSVKQAYGRFRFLVQAVGGTKQVWVEDSRLTF